MRGFKQIIPSSLISDSTALIEVSKYKLRLDLVTTSYKYINSSSLISDSTALNEVSKYKLRLDLVTL